jgi:small-conductance mechanosensitive channel
MKRTEIIVFLVLAVLLAGTVVGVVLTRRPPGQRRSLQAMRNASLVDQHPLQTAKALAALAATPGERNYANRALQLADNSVDLAFAIALRDAGLHPTPPTPETQHLAQRVQEIESRVKADQDLIQQLKQTPRGKQQQDEIQQQLEVAEAELAMDQDALGDAKRDLAGGGGDLRSTIQRLMNEHEATSHADTAVPESQVRYQRPTSLSSQVRTWWSFRSRYTQLLQAQEEAKASSVALKQTRKALDEQLRQQRVAIRDTHKTGGASAAAAQVHELAEQERTVADYDHRIQDEEDLCGVYRDWAGLAARLVRANLNAMLKGVAWILVICLAVFGADLLIGRFEARLPPDRRMLRSVRFIVRFGLQVVALALILLVIFGTPGQMTTLLGLAGAGLTVALKDFIVAFFGWFILMGRNGIRVGDWVEINGIGGEVVEVGLLRTVLLETGSWSDAGHPTGRKVVFTNSFAIEGHFFNFSTSGQWLWDELDVLVPPGEDPYPVIEEIQALVTKETAADARLAEQEWQKVARSRTLKSFSAAPGINVRPTNIGVNILVRYITRAHERYELRTRLYREVVQLLRNRNIPHPQVASGVSPGGSS